jgi:hypothetical protein
MATTGNAGTSVKGPGSNFCSRFSMVVMGRAFQKIKPLPFEKFALKTLSRVSFGQNQKPLIPLLSVRVKRRLFPGQNRFTLKQGRACSLLTFDFG